MMFKHYTVKALMASLLLVALSACASVPAFTSRTAPPLPEFSPITTPPVELPLLVVEFEVRPIPKKELHELAKVRMTDAELQCMSRVLYFEARGEGTQGMAAVGYVVLNRMATKGFPDTACGVVYQQNRRGCQFSWVCDDIPDVVRNQAAYARAQEIARDVMTTRQIPNPIADSIYFRHHAARSRYAHSQRLMAQVGSHKFFVEKM